MSPNIVTYVPGLYTSRGTTWYQVMKVDALNYPEHKETIGARLKAVYSRYEKILDASATYKLIAAAECYDLSEILLLKRTPVWAQYETHILFAKPKESAPSKKIVVVSQGTLAFFNSIAKEF